MKRKRKSWIKARATGRVPISSQFIKRNRMTCQPKDINDYFDSEASANSSKKEV